MMQPSHKIRETEIHVTIKAIMKKDAHEKKSRA